MVGYSDSDWAGCRSTGKSTRGGAVLRGTHLLEGWARTQQCVTLSSAEAELVALNKTAAEVLGCISMFSDFDVKMGGLLYGDSSAAIAISNRKGCGKLRHIHVGQLWLQEKIEDKSLSISKVKGENNPADLMTKILSRAEVDRRLRDMTIKVRYKEVSVNGIEIGNSARVIMPVYAAQRKKGQGRRCCDLI